MDAPYTVQTIYSFPIDIAIVRDAKGEDVFVSGMSQCQHVVSQLNAVPVLAKAIEDAAIELWHTSSPQLMEMAAALEAAVRIVNPGFALATIPYPPAPTEESELYAQVLNQDYAPAASVAGEENPAGS